MSEVLLEYKLASMAFAASLIKPARDILCVSTVKQKLWLFQDGELKAAYAASTSLRPPSCQDGSLGTPLGLHAVDGKIGDGEPVGMVFKGRLPVGLHFSEMPEEERSKNLVVTRILRLRGLEPGKNAGEGCDSYDRYIYIHGTNHEELIGQGATQGCVALANADMLELFDAVSDGAGVYIH